MEFYLVTSDHFLDRLLFKDSEDFKAAMCYVAVVGVITGVNILAFILMSNHVHFVLECSEKEAKRFIDTFKRLYGFYFCRKYGVSNYLRKLGVRYDRLRIEDESLERAIAYVQMNCVAANICSSHVQYPWGTGPVFFNAAPINGQKISNLSKRAQWRVLRSRVQIPDSYVLNDEGYIQPESYIKKEFVETLFRGPGRYNYFLSNSSKARKRLEGSAAPSFRDQVILSSTQDLCRSLFRTDDISSLRWEQKAELMQQIHRRLNSDINQLCRVSGIPYAELAKMLEFAG